MQRSLMSMLAVAGLVAGFTVSPAAPWSGSGPVALAQSVSMSEDARPTVVGSRIGIHPDKTRMVLEITGRVAFRTSAQDGERVVIDLPNTSWSGSESPKPGRGVIRSYHTEQGPSGTLRLVLLLAQPAKLGSAFLMPPSEGYKLRLVLDLEPGAPGPIQPEKPRERVTVAPLPVVTPPPAIAVKPVPAFLPPPPAPVTQAPPPPPPARMLGVPASLQPGAAASSPPVPLVTTASVRPPPPPPPSMAPLAPLVAAPGVPAKPHRTTPSGKPVVALDPGHGGVDPGATGINGIHEKDITLATAFEVRRQLEASGRFRVMMTREEDEFVPLRERVARARQAGADLFISLHADSIAKSEIHGLSIYTQSDTGSDHEAETLAAKENRADAIGGIDLSHENDQVATILIDLAQRDTRNHSHRFATMVLRDAGRVLPLLPKPDRSAAFAVLTAPDVPSVLIEMGYLSNAKDASLLTQAQHRQRLAGILAHSVEGYFNWRSGGRRQ